MIWYILTLGLILRLISLNQSLWLDEAINVMATQHFSFIGMITQYAVADFHPPGFFIILWPWVKLFGTGEVAVRIPSVIFGIITIYLVYLLGKKIYSKYLGLIAALLLAVNPLHIYYSQEARMYSLAALAVILSVYLWTKVLKEEKVNMLFIIASNLLVFSSDYVAYLIFPAQFIYLIIFKREKVMMWLKLLLASLLIGSWWLPIFFKQLSTGSIAAANLPTWKFVVGGFDIKSVPLTFIKFIIGRISLADKFIYYSLLVPVCILFLFLILRSLRFAKDIIYLFIIWLVVPIILATLVSFILPIYSYFRLIFTLPAFLLLIALGIISFKSKLRYLFLSVVFLILFFSSVVYLFNNTYQREDWKGLVSFFRTIDPKDQILFESSGTLPPFDYYAKGELNAKGALKDFPAKTDADLIDLNSDLRNVKNVFLVNYLIDISDSGRLVAKKLDQLGYVQSEILNFNGVGFVYHYVKK